MRRSTMRANAGARVDAAGIGAPATSTNAVTSPRRQPMAAAVPPSRPSTNAFVLVNVVDSSPRPASSAVGVSDVPVPASSNCARWAIARPAISGVGQRTTWLTISRGVFGGALVQLHSSWPEQSVARPGSPAVTIAATASGSPSGVTGPHPESSPMRYPCGTSPRSSSMPRDGVGGEGAT